VALAGRVVRAAAADNRSAQIRRGTRSYRYGPLQTFWRIRRHLPGPGPNFPHSQGRIDMSAAEAAKQAARLTDPVEHGLGMLGMSGGVGLGAGVGALRIAATVATGGGALALALAGVGAVGATAGTGLAGGQLANGLSTLFGCSGIVTGNIVPACSSNVHVGG